MEYFNLGNDVVNLIAITENGSEGEDIIKFEPFKANEDGSLFVWPRYELINSFGEFYSPFIVDVDDEFFRTVPNTYGLINASINYLYDPYHEDMFKKTDNHFIEMLGSEARTTSVNETGSNISNRGGHFIVNITAIASTGTVTPSIQGLDIISDNYYDILVGTTLSTVGTHVFKVYPGIGQTT